MNFRWIRIPEKSVVDGQVTTRRVGTSYGLEYEAFRGAWEPVTVLKPGNEHPEYKVMENCYMLHPQPSTTTPAKIVARNEDGSYLVSFVNDDDEIDMARVWPSEITPTNA